MHIKERTTWVCYIYEGWAFEVRFFSPGLWGREDGISMRKRRGKIMNMSVDEEQVFCIDCEVILTWPFPWCSVEVCVCVCIWKACEPLAPEQKGDQDLPLVAQTAVICHVFTVIVGHSDSCIYCTSQPLPPLVHEPSPSATSTRAP